MLATKKQPFRELPVRKRMAKPDWLPRKGDDLEEPEYKLSLVNGVYQMCMYEVRNSLLSRRERIMKRRIFCRRLETSVGRKRSLTKVPYIPSIAVPG